MEVNETRAGCYGPRAPSSRAVRPYAEATAGFARLRTGFTGPGSAAGFVNGALGLFDTTEPLLGVGGDVSVNQVRIGVGVRF